MIYFSEVLADTPSGYWRLGEGSDALPAADASGNGNTGTYTNTIGTTPSQVGALAGDPDTAVLFTRASSGYVSVLDSTSLDLGDTFTLEAWVKLAATGQATAKHIVSKGVNGYCFRIGSTDKLELLKDRIALIVTSTTAITNTNWHHVVATKNGATVKLYLDAVDVTGTVTNATCANNAANLFIGVDNTASSGGTPDATTYFDGFIDEVAVYPTALSAARITVHLDSAPTPIPMPPPPSLGWGVYTGSQNTVKTWRNDSEVVLQLLTIPGLTTAPTRTTAPTLLTATATAGGFAATSQGEAWLADQLAVSYGLTKTG
jgi:hypothetical protein